MKSVQILKQAENLIKHLVQSGQVSKFDQKARKEYQGLVALNINNFGCLFKQFGLYKVALQYFKRCLAVEKQMLAENTLQKTRFLNAPYSSHDQIILTQISKATSVVTTLINVCACYSKLGKHESALGYAIKSTSTLQNFYQPAFYDVLMKVFVTYEEQPLVEVQLKYWQTLQIAYYNRGVEHEHLGQNLKAVECYEKAKDVLTKKTLFEDSHLKEHTNEDEFGCLQ